MQKYPFFIILIILNLSYQCHSQEIVKSSKTFKTISDPVTAVYYLPSDSDIVRLISIEKDIPDSSPYINNTYFSQYLIFSNGAKLTFQKDEVLIDFKNGFLITRQKNTDDLLYIILRYYNLEKYKLIFKSQISIRVESQILLFNNGNILISDEYEFNGKTFKFYNTNLELISQYDPLGENGFKSSVFYEYDNKLLAAIQSQEPDSITSNLIFEIFDLNSGNKIQEIKSSTRIEDLTSCIGNSNYVLVFADKKLIKINSSGQEMWIRNIDWPSLEMTIVKQRQEVVVVVNDTIQSLALETGRIKWSKSFNDINSIKNLSTTSRIGFGVLRLSTIFNDSSIGVLLAIYDKDKINVSNKYSTSFLIFDLEGINKYVTNNTFNNNTTKMNVLESKILIYNENNINIYEKQ